TLPSKKRYASMRPHAKSGEEATAQRDGRTMNAKRTPEASMAHSIPVPCSFASIRVSPGAFRTSFSWTTLRTDVTMAGNQHGIIGVWTPFNVEHSHGRSWHAS